MPTLRTGLPIQGTLRPLDRHGARQDTTSGPVSVALARPSRRHAAGNPAGPAVAPWPVTTVRCAAAHAPPCPRFAHSGAAPAPGDYPPLGEARRGRIALFVGCAGSAQQPGTLGAALTLLRRVGFTVSIVTEPGCCGALAQHAGDTRRAAQLAERNRRALDGGFDAIVSVASGCGIHLDDYAPALPAPHYDINRFLIEQGRLSADDFRPSNRSVALHTPCSVQNVYRGEKWARELLALIPQLRVEALGEAGQCCGAAGDYMLRHPHTAQQLRKPLLAQFVALGSESLLTSNIGCAMHLADGLRENPLPVHVLHPVELLAEQLK